MCALRRDRVSIHPGHHSPLDQPFHLIRRALGAREVGSVRWLDRCRVLWSLVQHDYDELLTVGRFLLRAQEGEGRRRFPALVKGGGGRRKGADDEASGDDTAPEAPVSEPEKP